MLAGWLARPLKPSIVNALKASKAKSVVKAGWLAGKALNAKSSVKAIKALNAKSIVKAGWLAGWPARPLRPLQLNQP